MIAIAKKQLMTSYKGKAVTLLGFLACVVTKTSIESTNIGFNLAISIINSSFIRVKHVTETKGKLPNEFGSVLTVNWLLPPVKINLIAITKGKGFAGVMKRHGFSGLRASHGVSLSHRSAGSIGARQDPGRVWRGKKMAGRLGGNKRTLMDVRIVKLNSFVGNMVVYGPIPGAIGSVIRVFSAK